MEPFHGHLSPKVIKIFKCSLLTEVRRAWRGNRWECQREMREGGLVLALRKVRDRLRALRPHAFGCTTGYEPFDLTLPGVQRLLEFKDAPRP